MYFPYSSEYLDLSLSVFLHFIFCLKLSSFVLPQAKKICERTQAIHITRSNILKDNTDLTRAAQRYQEKKQVGSLLLSPLP